jgi:hypothetical protein
VEMQQLLEPHPKPPLLTVSAAAANLLQEGPRLRAWLAPLVTVTPSVGANTICE